MDKYENAKSLFIQGLEEYKKENYDQAENLFKLSLEFLPDRQSTLNNLSAIYIKLNKLEQAEKVINKILLKYPDDSVAFLNLGNINEKKFNYSEAIEAYNKAIKNNKNYVEAYFNRANVFVILGRLKDALSDYQKAFEIEPKYDYLLGTLIHIQMYLCIWINFDKNLDILIENIENLEKTIPCFAILGLSDSLNLQLKVAKKRAEDLYPIKNESKTININYQIKKRIRIGYYSADFHKHATSYLMARLFEIHDTSKFEIYAFSYGENLNDSMRVRIKNAFEHFYEVSKCSPKEIAKISRNLEIDIAIDLKGLTFAHRIEIFSYRAAPIQINYLGYPGTSGASYIDYIIADNTLIPVESQNYYTEKIIYMPNSYQVNDNTKEISKQYISREQFGLPNNVFVFCCFNNNFKILPSVLDVWSNILKRVPTSIMWLMKDNETASDNIIKEFKDRGINKDRIIFAERIELTLHLARHKLADLFIDTFPYNAHTTASDALWSGLPVLTRIGESFVSRVAASLLNALDLPFLITKSELDYENLAVKMATNKEEMNYVKLKLENNLRYAPLFNTTLFARHLESAYTNVYYLHKKGKKPRNIYVKNLNS